MIVAYTHEDGTVQEVSTDDLSAKESADIESVTELEWDDVERSLKGGKPTAMRAVLWVVERRTKPSLLFSQFDVPGWKRRLKASLERSDILDLVETLRSTTDPSEEGFEQMLGYLRTLAHDPADVEWAMGETGPKDLETATAQVPAPVSAGSRKTSSNTAG